MRQFHRKTRFNRDGIALFSLNDVQSSWSRKPIVSNQTESVLYCPIRRTAMLTERYDVRHWKRFPSQLCNKNKFGLIKYPDLIIHVSLPHFGCFVDSSNSRKSLAERFYHVTGKCPPFGAIFSVHFHVIFVCVLPDTVLYLKCLWYVFLRTFSHPNT